MSSASASEPGDLFGRAEPYAYHDLANGEWPSSFYVGQASQPMETFHQPGFGIMDGQVYMQQPGFYGEMDQAAYPLENFPLASIPGESISYADGHFESVAPTTGMGGPASMLPGPMPQVQPAKRISRSLSRETVDPAFRLPGDNPQVPGAEDEPAKYIKQEQIDAVPVSGALTSPRDAPFIEDAEGPPAVMARDGITVDRIISPAESSGRKTSAITVGWSGS